MLQKILRFFQKPGVIDAQELLGFSIDTPEALDLLWHGYSQSKDPSIVRRIISVLDRRDAVRDHLHVWLNCLPKNESAEKTVRDLVERYHFPIDVDSRQIHGPLDLDIYVARVVQAGALKFADLPFTIPPGKEPRGHSTFLLTIGFTKVSQGTTGTQHFFVDNRFHESIVIVVI